MRGGAPVAQAAIGQGKTGEEDTVTRLDMVDRTGRWSLATLPDGRRILSFPVANRLVDYEEDYLLAEEEHSRIMSDPEKGHALAARCRAHLEDGRLLRPPGSDRGIGS